jgi:hypothetical protein
VADFALLFGDGADVRVVAAARLLPVFAAGDVDRRALAPAFPAVFALFLPLSLARLEPDF